jgi:NADH-quinone oxidoreductase subunit F
MYTITIGTGTCGVSAGADIVLNEFQQLADEQNAGDVRIGETGCMGMCYKEVLVEINDGADTFLYGNVNPEGAQRIFREHVRGGTPVEDLLVLRNYARGPEESFLSKQKRIVLRNCGYIDPMSIEDYLERDGYKAIDKVLHNMNPEELIKLVAESGLRGRGGAGFLTGDRKSVV